MKNLTSPELVRFQVDTSEEMKAAFREMDLDVPLYSYRFSLVEENKEYITNVIVSPACTVRGVTTTTHASFSSVLSDNLKTVSAKQVYFATDFLMEKNETLAWYYDPESEHQRAAMFRLRRSVNYDMNEYVLHMEEYTGQIPPFEKVYQKRVHSNNGFKYSRGTIDNWTFILVRTKRRLPWLELKAISNMEFKGAKIMVLFNQTTKSHPDKYIIWRMPD